MDRRGTNNRQLVATHVRMIPLQGDQHIHTSKPCGHITRHNVGLRITSRQRRCCSHARDTSHRNSVASHHTRGNSLTVTLGLDREGSVAPPTPHYTRSVCSTPFLFRCTAPDQVRCSRSGAVPARRHRQAAEALCASVLESARAQASAGARDRSALNPFDRTARPRRHLPNARKASRQSLQPGYETPPPSG